MVVLESSTKIERGIGKNIKLREDLRGIKQRKKYGFK
jgi:hypothetical protein